MHYDISVIVPVYNTEEYLPRCLDSLVAQTLRSVEIIIVDDASPGNCADLFRAYAEKCPNLHYVKHAANKSLFQARISGIRAATGTYVLFVDADDWISPDTCRELFHLAQKEHADILQYPMYFGASEEDMRPHWHNRTGTIRHEGRDILTAFLDRSIWQTVCGKLFTRAVLLRALDSVDIGRDIYINSSSDMALFLPICWVARIYVNTDGCGKYFYFYDSRSMARSSHQDDARWNALCRSFSQTRSFSMGVMRKFEASAEECAMQEERMRMMLHWRIRDILSEKRERRVRLLSMLLQGYGQEAALAVPDHAFPLLCEAAQCAPLKDTAITHIGMFVRELNHSGIQRAASLQADMLVKAGYRVTFFTHESEQLNDFPYDRERIGRVTLPEGREQHWRAVQSACEAHTLDLCVMHDHWNEQAMYDMVAARLAGTRVVAMDHNMYFYPLHTWKSKLFAMRDAAYRLASAIICLSPTDAAWWRSAGHSQAVYIPNPPTFTPGTTTRSQGDTRNLLFVGRITELKGALALLHVFRKVLDREPYASLTVCGEFQSDAFRNVFMQRLHELGLGPHVQMAGRVACVEAYYAKAAVHLMPSAYEGFPMALMEAKAHGVPSVVFSMPYLAAATEEQGCVMVGREDVHGMAEAACRLLRDREYWLTMSDRAYDSFAPYSVERVRDAWKTLLDELSAGKTSFPAAEHIPAEKLLSMAMDELTSAMRFAGRQPQREGGGMNQPPVVVSGIPEHLLFQERVLTRLMPENTLRRRLAQCFLGLCRRFMK